VAHSIQKIKVGVKISELFQVADKPGRNFTALGELFTAQLSILESGPPLKTSSGGSSEPDATRKRRGASVPIFLGPHLRWYLRAF
jgi:hypothetical protein